MYLRYFFFTSGILFAIFGGLMVYYQPLSGDLTRLGYLSENKFGWYNPQPQQKVFSTPALDPDILVIGDSFSAKNIWQSRLTEMTGFTTNTISWENFKESPYCIVLAMKNAHPKIKYVLIQSVEPEAVSRLQQLGHFDTDCDNPITVKTIDLHQYRTQAARKVDGSITDYKFLTRMALNELNLHRDHFLSEKTYVSRLLNDGLFSNKKSEFLLFYINDIKNKKSWSNSTIKKSLVSYQKYSQALLTNGVTPILLVTPDKLTVYANYLQNKSVLPNHHFWEIMKDSKVNAIDLKEGFHDLPSQIIDLYLPNDTHLSTRGYQEMARIIMKNLNDKFKYEVEYP